MHAVLDVDVQVSAVLSASGPPAEIIRRNRDGAFELISSESLIAELNRTRAYPKIRKRIPVTQAAVYVSWLRDQSMVAPDPSASPAVRSPDSDDDHLLALAIDQRAWLVTGDQHLLGLGVDLPILTPAQFISALDEQT